MFDFLKKKSVARTDVNKTEDVPKLQLQEMKITSGVLPPKEGFDELNEEETAFFVEVLRQLTTSGFKPSSLKITRLSSGAFNVNYDGDISCYLGKINLYEPPEKYAVIKGENKRATKVFDTLEEAEEFAKTNEAYRIERKNQKKRYMQYPKDDQFEETIDEPFERYLELIPYWIKYISNLKKEYDDF